MSALRHLYYLFVYYLSWVWFGLGGLLLNLFCLPLLLWPKRAQLGSPVRELIRSMFSWWSKWLHASGALKVTWIDLNRAEITTGCVYVANHPTLVDAPILLSILPDAICIFKASLLRNPCVGPAAVLAGYCSGDTGVDMIRDAAEQVAAGRSLLVFPEGTRTTPGNRLNPLKPGFALIAKRAVAPIRLITIRSSPRLLQRGGCWWKAPHLPAWLEVTVHEEIPGDLHMPVAEITRLTQERLASLVGDVSSSASSCHGPRATSC